MNKTNYLIRKETEADYFEGRKESRLSERREKLHTADINRKAYWLQQQQA